MTTALDEPQSRGGMLLAHEWIASIGGSENVFRALMDTFHSADAMCLWNDVPETFGRPVRESALAASRLRGRKALALPFLPRTWQQVDLQSYGTVLASSHAFSHHLAGHAARRGLNAFAYVHTPARYVWAPEVEHRGRALPARLGSVALRRIDLRATDARVSYAANSAYIRDRIANAWGREARVIYPPVDVERIRSKSSWRDQLDPQEQQLFESLPSEFVLGASRLVDYKRLDLVIRTGELLDAPVVIAGHGPQREELEALAARASVPVVFVGRVSDPVLYALYQRAALFAFLSVEDFGIMPVEAIAAGTPVLVNSIGGARESVVSLAAGAEVTDLSDERELRAAAETALGSDLSRAAAGVELFSVSRFRSKVRSWVGGRHA